MAEGAGVELGSGGFDFGWGDVAALDGGVGPAGPVVVGRSSVEVEVVEPGGGAFGSGDEEGPALFVGEGGAENFKPDGSP